MLLLELQILDSVVPFDLECRTVFSDCVQEELIVFFSALFDVDR